MSNKYRRIVQAVFGSIWAILPEKLEAIVELVELKASGGTLSESEIQAVVGAASRSRAGSEGGVAVLPIVGVISQRMNLMSDFSGGTSTDKFLQEFRSALADPAVKSILLDVDSPGGTVYGVEEAAAEIFKARGQKKIVAQVNSLAASAAYWLASSVDEIVITPSGEAGSIGVFAMHTDFSKFDAEAGIKVTLISAGRFKTEGNEFEPLSEEAQEFLQGRVNDYYNSFLKDVARGRGKTATDVRKNFGEGRVFGADQALAVGMVDRIGTIDQTLARMMGTGSAKKDKSSLRGLAEEEASPIVAEEIEPKASRSRERDRLEIL